MPGSSHAERVDLTSDFEVPSEPLAMDVRDSNGRLVVRAGELPSRSLLERLRKMGVLEVYVRTREAASPDFWQKWGEEWLAQARSQFVLLTPENGVVPAELQRFDRVLEEAIGEFSREKASATRD